MLATAAGPFPGACAVHRWHGSWISPEDEPGEDFPRALERELRSLLPEDARVLTLADGVGLDLGEHPVLPFAEREGYWGHPEDSADAISELERLTARGWAWLVALEHAYWWFESYPEFMASVEERALAVHRRRHFTAFQLPPSQS
jgi:hypothetical protein